MCFAHWDAADAALLNNALVVQKMKITKFEFSMISLLLIAALVYFTTRDSEFVKQCESEGGIPIVVETGGVCSFVTESECKKHNGLWQNNRTCKMPDGSFLVETGVRIFDGL